MTRKRRRPRGKINHLPSVTSRPTIYCEYWGEQIEQHLREGWSLRRYCLNPRNPGMGVVMGWLAKDVADPETGIKFREHYTKGRDDAAEADADFVGYIGEEVMHGRIDPQAARAAIDARKWSAGKRNPKKYGDRVQLEGPGKGGEFKVVHMLPEDADL